jgi:hypothetical protein
MGAVNLFNTSEFSPGVTVLPPGFAYNPTTQVLTITGTNFMFKQATTAAGSGTHTTYTFTNDGAAQSFLDSTLSGVIVNGASVHNSATLFTNDTYVDIHGKTQETTEFDALGPGGGQILKYNGSGQVYTFLQMNKFDSSFAYGGHADAGQLLGVPGVANSFVTAGIYSYESGGGEFHLVSGTAYVYGYATSVMDQAFHYDGSGPSTFIVSGTAYSLMEGTDLGLAFFNEGVGFTSNEGIAQHAGQDVATFYDSPRNDVFTAFPGAASMTANNSSGILVENDLALGFAFVSAFSFNGGFDVASNHDPSHVIVFGFIVMS